MYMNKTSALTLTCLRTHNLHNYIHTHPIFKTREQAHTNTSKREYTLKDRYFHDT